MTEAVEFDVPDAGAPALEGQESTSHDEPFVDPATLAAIPRWSQAEAAQVVGGLVANLTLAMYAIKWQQAPEPQLWPAIAGDPQREFPLLGTGLAPILDFIAPKGSAAAVGVSLTAGVGELIGAMARRWEVVNMAPPTKTRPGAGPARAAEPEQHAPAASSEGNGFRFSGDALRVLEQDQPLAGMGIE